MPIITLLTGAIVGARLFAPSSESLSFQQFEEGFWAMYLLDVRLGVLYEMADDLVVSVDAQWEPSGETVAYTHPSWPYDGRNHILHIVEYGTRQHRHTAYNTRMSVASLNWSVEGDLLAITGYDNATGQQRLYAITPGGDVHTYATEEDITGLVWRAGEVTYSTRSGRLIVAEPIGDELRTISQAELPPWANLSRFAAGGEHFAYSRRSTQDNKRYCLYIGQAGFEGTAVACGAEREVYFAPVWSPSGTRLAFQMSGGVYNSREDGSDLRYLGIGGQPQWAGDDVLFISDRSGVEEIYLMRANRLRQLTHTGNDKVGVRWRSSS